MNGTSDFIKVKESIDAAGEILIVTHEHPTFDSIGSSLALLLGLTSLGKRVTVACPDPVTVGLSSFIGANKVSTAIGKKNFIVSLDYIEGSIEKVSYNIEGNKFNLIIEPRVGFPPFEQDKVHFSQASGDPSIIFVIDTIHLGGLKSIYEEHKELFAGKTVINIDRHANNSNFGQINIVDPVASSIAELVAQLLSNIGVKLTQDIATNLINALYGATSNFLVPNVSANAFELASVCIKAGGVRFAPPPMPDGWPTPGRLPGMPMMPKPSGVGFPQTPRPTQAMPIQYPVAPVSPLPAPQAVSHSQEPHDHQAQSGQALPSSGQAKQSFPQVGQAPADWLKPKIFKSTNIS